MQKYVKGGVAYVTWPTFIIFGPLYISGICKAKNFIFGVRIDRQLGLQTKNAKVGQKGCGLHHVTYLYTFVTALSLE